MFSYIIAVLIVVMICLSGCLYIYDKIIRRLSIERDSAIAQLRNLDQDYRNDKNAITCKLNKLQKEHSEEVVRLTNKVIQLENLNQGFDNYEQELEDLAHQLVDTENRAKLVEKDCAARMEDFKKHPTLAVMTDGQVYMLAEMLAVHIREIMDAKKEYIN